MKISREIKTAVLVLSGIALFIYMFSYLKGEDLFSNTETFYTEFNYNALKKASPVTVKGNKIGMVEDVRYDFESGKTVVEFSVNPELKFSKNSRMRLYQTGLMGGNALAIIDAKDGDIAKPGDYIISEIKPGLVTTLEKDFSGVSENLGITLRSTDTLMTNLNALVVDESDNGLKQTLTELNSTLKAFKSLSFSIENVVKQNDKKITSALDSFEKISAELALLTKDLNKAELSKTIKDFDATLVTINKLITGLNNGEGSMGKLLKDDALYKNLEGASKEMELLLLDIKLHPARYRRILSKKEIPYKAPTEAQLNN
ncbi:MAG: MlaD family protein [Winogradskyella sp.]